MASVDTWAAWCNREAVDGEAHDVHAGAALQELQDLAADGWPHAFVDLGNHLVHGRHVQPDHEQVRCAATMAWCAVAGGVARPHAAACLL